MASNRLTLWVKLGSVRVPDQFVPVIPFPLTPLIAMPNQQLIDVFACGGEIMLDRDQFDGPILQWEGFQDVPFIAPGIESQIVDRARGVVLSQEIAQ